MADRALTRRLEAELEAVMEAIAADFGSCSNATADRVIAALDAARENASSSYATVDATAAMDAIRALWAIRMVADRRGLIADNGKGIVR